VLGQEGHNSRQGVTGSKAKNYHMSFNNLIIVHPEPLEGRPDVLSEERPLTLRDQRL
jgi:hypothetical protein